MNDAAHHRKALRQLLPDGLILLSGGTEVARNNDVNYVFRQHSDFLYLTGAEEPRFHLLLDPKRRNDALLIPRIDADHRVWLGHVPGPAEAKQLYGVDKVYYADEAERVLASVKKGYRRCYADPFAWKRFGKKLASLSNAPARLSDALQTLRVCKTPGEIKLLQRASDVSRNAHLAVMRAAKPGVREFELQAEFERVCMKSGLKHQGYPPIVAAGVNGAVLHYHHNNSVLKNGDMLLIDAAAECGGYAADITRTYPINGRFSRRQKDIYSIVLEAQKRCIERSRPGVLSGDLHILSMRIIAEGLKSLGLLRGTIDELVLSGAVRLFYPHGLTHTLGLDVHDTMGGKARQIPTPKHIRLRFNARLEPGFVITMEPGIYFNDALINDKERRAKLRKLVDFPKVERFLDFGGVRIEDDIVIQRSGPPLNLTTVPKEIKELEAVLR